MKIQRNITGNLYSRGYIIYYWEEPDYNCKDVAKLFRKGLIYACR